MSSQSQSKPRKIFGFSILFGFALASLGLSSAVTDKIRFYEGDDKSALQTYFIVNLIASIVNIIAALALVVAANYPKIYFTLMFLSLGLVTASILLEELYISTKNISDKKLLLIIKIGNYLLTASFGIILGMAAETPST